MIKAREEVSKLTIARMAVYYGILEKIRDEGEVICASTHLSQRTGIASSVIRKDLANFGGFGTKGVGYEIEFLLSWIREILGYNTRWNAVLVGSGVPFAVGANYNDLLPPGFKISAVVDLNKKNHGCKIPGIGVTVSALGNLASLIKSQAISMGIITVPPKQAQKVANAMIKGGIKGIANFSPVPVRVPDNIALSQMSVNSCLSQLSYSLRSEGESKSPSLASRGFGA